MALGDVETLCSSNITVQAVQARLTRLLVQFDIDKGHLTPSTRRKLRQQFSALAEQCQQRPGSNATVSLAMKLADHAYKLPEGACVRTF